jgi:hypothetical protein
LFGEGLDLPANKVCGFGCAFEVPVIAESRSLGGAEDISHNVHEEWAPRVPKSTSTLSLKKEGGKFNEWKNKRIFVKSGLKITHTFHQERRN